MFSLSLIFKKKEILLFIICFQILLLSLTILFFMFSKISLGVFFVLLFLALTSVLFIGYQNFHKEIVDIIYDSLISAIKNKGLKSFNKKVFLTTNNFSEHHFVQASEKVYKKFVLKVLNDYQITDKERVALDFLKEKIDISVEISKKIELNAKKEIYHKELEKALADGLVIEKESLNLQLIRKKLKITDEEALQETRNTVLAGYRVLFCKFAKDGMITESDFGELNNYAVATGLSISQAAQSIKKEAIALYGRITTMVCQNEIINKDEIEILNSLESVLKLSKHDISDYKEQLKASINFSEIRKGNLPRISIDYILGSDEICHFFDSCVFKYTTSADNSYEIHGELIVTNKRIIFDSRQKNFEFKPNKIIGITFNTNSVYLKCSTNSGQGEYKTKKAKILAEILKLLATKFSMELNTNLNQERSRHVPDHVKASVWQRDGGICVKCGSDVYLEFDHIIPFSKGGANTENNIQLLCRKCNISKGNDLF